MSALARTLSPGIRRTRKRRPPQDEEILRPYDRKIRILRPYDRKMFPSCDRAYLEVVARPQDTFVRILRSWRILRSCGPQTLRNQIRTPQVQTGILHTAGFTMAWRPYYRLWATTQRDLARRWVDDGLTGLSTCYDRRKRV